MRTAQRPVNPISPGLLVGIRLSATGNLEATVGPLIVGRESTNATFDPSIERGCRHLTIRVGNCRITVKKVKSMFLFARLCHGATENHRRLVAPREPMRERFST